MTTSPASYFPSAAQSGGDVPSWWLPGGSQTTDPQAALAGALITITSGEGTSVRI
jgi:hypothetical protein